MIFRSWTGPVKGKMSIPEKKNNRLRWDRGVRDADPWGKAAATPQ